ncbi:hypothetical protein [Methylorubrum sp. DB1722]|uniref:hypothetical protein n=1 Tax=Methylorubrum sp. DB1722 TaxID=2478916 RepID=UPI0018E2F147|nr:hypothetical protein [Methylorubrum sp. DB1722]MBI1689522.1 hypothetical protein [Methylorubrum sp. DB1722]
MDVWNTYAEWPEDRCLRAISHLQDQLASGAQMIQGPNGGATMRTPDQARYDVWELRCRVAWIRGTPRPPPPPKLNRSRARLRAVRIDYDPGY